MCLCLFKHTRVLPVSMNMIPLIQMTQIPFQFTSHLLLLHFPSGSGGIENYTVKNDHNFNNKNSKNAMVKTH